MSKGLTNSVIGGAGEGLYVWKKYEAVTIPAAHITFENSAWSRDTTNDYMYKAMNSTDVDVSILKNEDFDGATGTTRYGPPDTVSISNGIITYTNSNTTKKYEFKVENGIFYQKGSDLYNYAHYGALTLDIVEHTRMGDFIDYIVSDSILSYPLNGQKGDYWYELVQSNVDWGEVTLTSDQTSITVQHNLGEVPKWAGIFPNEKVTNMVTGRYSTLYEMPFTFNGTEQYWQGAYAIQNSSTQNTFQSPRTPFTNSQITFTGRSHDYPFVYTGNGWGTYYWFALGSPKSLLSILSWQQIGDLVLKAEQGTVNLSDYFSIGDTKPVTLTTGETIELQIAGFNHDTFSDGVTAPVTFVMKDCLNTKAQMNGSDANAGGYPASAMKTYVETNIYDKLPSDLKTLVAPVKKKWYTTYNDANSLTEGNYNVWLLSEAEVFDSVTQTIGTGEGTKYPIFTDNASRVKKVNGTANVWWLGSCMSRSSSNFVVVFSGGSVGYVNATGSGGVAAGLCIRGNA